MPSPESSPQSQCLAGDSWETVYGVCVWRGFIWGTLRSHSSQVEWFGAVWGD